MTKFHSVYAPDIYEVVHNGARIGSVTKYGRSEWAPSTVPGRETPLSEYRTRREAGAAMVLAWDRDHA